MRVTLPMAEAAAPAECAPRRRAMSAPVQGTIASVTRSSTNSHRPRHSLSSVLRASSTSLPRCDNYFTYLQAQGRCRCRLVEQVQRQHHLRIILAVTADQRFLWPGVELHATDDRRVIALAPAATGE